eukprot:2467511-Prymnesium_polylepis.2
MEAVRYAVPHDGLQLVKVLNDRTLARLPQFILIGAAARTCLEALPLHAWESRMCTFLGRTSTEPHPDCQHRPSRSLPGACPRHVHRRKRAMPQSSAPARLCLRPLNQPAAEPQAHAVSPQPP